MNKVDMTRGGIEARIDAEELGGWLDVNVWASRTDRTCPLTTRACFGSSCVLAERMTSTDERMDGDAGDRVIRHFRDTRWACSLTDAATVVESESVTKWREPTEQEVERWPIGLATEDRS